MKRIELIKKEINSVKTHTDKLIGEISNDRWMTTPIVIETNLNWQMGHVFLATYLHGIASITGVNMSVRNKIDLKAYVKYYGPDSNPLNNIDKKPCADKLKLLYELGYKLTCEILEKIKESDLDMPTEITNPSAKTKYEALMWLIQHNSWHNGQIAVLRRVLKEM